MIPNRPIDVGSRLDRDRWWRLVSPRLGADYGTHPHTFMLIGPLFEAWTGCCYWALVTRYLNTRGRVSVGSTAMIESRKAGSPLRHDRNLVPLQWVYHLTGLKSVRSSVSLSIESFARRRLGSFARRRLGSLVERLELDTTAISDKATLASRRSVEGALSLLRTHEVVNVAKKRFGSANDGGYVMLDDTVNVDRALSLGISQNDDWDSDFAGRGIPVDQYDDSVDAAPTSHPLLRFHRMRVVASANGSGITIAQLLEMPLAYILKMDIEGSEWECLDATPSSLIARCRQIVIEFHSLRRLADEAFRQRAVRVLEKLAATHIPIHAHANNNGRVCMVAGIPLPDVLEITFVLRSGYETRKSSEVFPTSMDAPNDPHRHDIYLGSFAY